MGISIISKKSADNTGSRIMANDANSLLHEAREELRGIANLACDHSTLDMISGSQLYFLLQPITEKITAALEQCGGDAEQTHAPVVNSQVG